MFPSPEIIELSEEELTTLGFLGPSKLLSLLETPPCLLRTIVRPARRCS